MTIAPLQIPGWQQPRDLDFSALAQLPQVYRKAQQDAWTLANIDRLGAAQELTPAIREYNLARRQGFNGTFIDFRKARLSQGDIDTSLSNARATIAANPAARNAVLERLRDAGINPPGDI